MDWRERRTIRRVASFFALRLRGSPILPPGVLVGRHTYGYGADAFQIFMPDSRIEVGAFCSIHNGARVLAGSEHMMTHPSTFPFNARLFDRAQGNTGETIDRGTTIIGNDVWIGAAAIILSGVLVGDGAVIGAGAVVSKWVPPFAVVAGNPGRILRYRFDSDTRRRLLALRWWDWDDATIREARQWFMADVESFLYQMEQVHEPRPESELARRLRQASPDEVTPNGRPDGDQYPAP